MQAIPRKSVRPEELPLYDATLKLLKDTNHVGRMQQAKPPAKRKPRAKKAA
jgi:hypothetical protein